MKAQVAAEGILKSNDWGDSKMYHVPCSCGNNDDAIDFEVEADELGVTVTTYTTQKTNFWTESISKNYNIDNPYLQEFDWFWKDIWNGFVTRLRLTKDIWWHGYVKYQSTAIMSEQQALNYAETINSAVRDVKFFREEKKWNGDLQNRIARKLAEESDCV
jgi:hypothetical protein